MQTTSFGPGAGKPLPAKGLAANDRADQTGIRST